MIRAAALVAALALTLSACGEDDEAPISEAETELTIVLDGDGDGGEEAVEAAVQCPGADAPPAACGAIAELPEDPTAPVPAQTPCTEIYGGPDTVRIEGTLEGEPVDAELTRGNGCEIERFERFTPLLRSLFPDYRPGEALSP